MIGPHVHMGPIKKHNSKESLRLIKTCLPLRLVLSLDEEVFCLHQADDSYGDGEKTKQTSRGHRDDLRSAFS